jgi:hypothetical protein
MERAPFRKKLADFAMGFGTGLVVTLMIGKWYFTEYDPEDEEIDENAPPFEFKIQDDASQPHT